MRTGSPLKLLFVSVLAGGFLLVPSPLYPAAPQAEGTGAAPVWEVSLDDFSADAYGRAVERLFADFEARSGRRLVPGAHGRVGLKVYSDSGPGLATPPELVRAVMDALSARGFDRKDIFLVGLSQRWLRLSGFLPSLSEGGGDFDESPVYVLDSGKYYDPVWYYDSPLPTRFEPLNRRREGPETETAVEDDDRKSFLPAPLFLQADFWINLPVYTDHPVLGVNGALVNATLWNASNTIRFFRSPANAPAAVAEMAAIPELRQSWALNLVTLERYQFIGGPFFNSLYTRSEPRLWMSSDPVILDALMLERINQARKASGFKTIPEEELRLLEFAEQLGLGSARPASMNWIRLDDAPPG